LQSASVLQFLQAPLIIYKKPMSMLW